MEELKQRAAANGAARQARKRQREEDARDAEERRHQARVAELMDRLEAAGDDDVVVETRTFRARDVHFFDEFYTVEAADSDPNADYYHDLWRIKTKQ